MRGVGHAVGGIQTKDVQQADAYRKALPGHFGLLPHQVHVEPGSGVTKVTIFGVNAEAERKRITDAVDSLNKQNPQLNPLRLRFQG